MKKSFLEYCKEVIIDRLPQYEDSTTYGCDLGMLLTEDINADGSATYNREEAKEYIKEWWNEASEVYEYQKDNYGECSQNPFENPEAFHVIMIIEGVNSLINQCEFINGDNWNEEFTINAEAIETIIKQIENLKIEF